MITIGFLLGALVMLAYGLSPLFVKPQGGKVESRYPRTWRKHGDM